MSTLEVHLDDRTLKKLMKAFKGDIPKMNLGVLGAALRKDGKKSNGEILMKHEFGLDGMPVRSVLRTPLTNNLEKYIKEAEAFSEDAIKAIAKEGSLLGWMKKVAVLCETIVSDAFDSAGFGLWPASDMTHKKNHQTLVETQQLRDSITSEVKV